MNKQEGTIVREHTKFNPLKIKTYLSVCVRYFDKTTENHVAFYIYINGVPYICEAWKRVIFTKAEHWFRKENSYKFIPPPSDYDVDYAREKCLDMAGWTEYNLLNTMFYQLIKILFKKWIGPTGEKANKNVQCAQLWAIAAKRETPWLWKPSDIDNNTTNLVK